MWLSKKKIAIAVVVLVSLSFAWGYVNSYSNLVGSYPSFSSKTMRPSKPFGKDSWAASRYKSEVDEYRNDCQNYITAANRDIATINNEINKAINETNMVVREYNSWAAYGY
jgi:hypothetical protein